MTRGVLFGLDETSISTCRLYIESFRRTLKPCFHRALTDSDIPLPQASLADMTGSQ